MMLPTILADSRIPQDALDRLGHFGTVIPVSSSRIVYPAISGHPDIFFCQVHGHVVYAPNTPLELVERLAGQGIVLVEGNDPLGKQYPETAKYNALVTPDLFMHNLDISDARIRDNAHGLEKLHIKQGYARCNTVALREGRFITSDRGIEKLLVKKGKKVLYVDPAGIVLSGHSNGFIGGTCGIFQESIFFIGSLDCFPEGKKVRDFLQDEHVVELYEGPLFDGGSLIFMLPPIT